VQVSVKIQDVFTTELVELLTTMQELQLQGLQKIVIGDQAGGCHPRQVFQMIELLQKVVQCDIQAGFQDDTGCAIANAFCAVEAGASQIETSVLGIGQRNGVVALGGYLARLIVTNRDHLLATYAPTHLPDIETLVLEAFGLDLPFNNYITGFCAFNHKAGIHMKAVLNNPQTYESIRPDDFGVSRNVQYASRLTGWNAIKSRATQMNLTMTDEQCRSCTEIIKSMADQRTISNQEVDRTLRLFAEGVFEQDSSVLHQESSVVGQRSSAVSRSGPVSVS
jgi:homocitrate synthase